MRKSFLSNTGQSSNQSIHVIRLVPHDDLKRSILHLAKEKNIKAGAVITCVGSLEQFNLRFANQPASIRRTGHFEIVSLTGTFSDSAAHLHLAVSDETGNTIGGHLADENLIYTTAEIVVIQFNDLEFMRESDETYGYLELAIKQAKNGPLSI